MGLQPPCKSAYFRAYFRPMAQIHPRTRMLRARQAILAAGGQGDAKHRSRAFTKVAAALPNNPRTGLPMSRQAVENWYRDGRIPRWHVEAIARMAGLQACQVDPLEFPAPPVAPNV